MTTRLSSTSRSAAVDAVAARLSAGAGAGVIKVYTGPQPATPATSPTGTLLLTLTLNDPAYDVAVNGVAALDVSPAVSANAVADGTAGWFRASDSDGGAVFDGACGLSGAELNLNTLSLTTGLAVSVVSGTLTQPA